MNVTQVTPFPVYPPARGAEHRSHGLMMGRENEDHVTRFSATPFASNRTRVEDIDHNYIEYRSRNIPSSVQGYLLNMVGAPRILESKILRYTNEVLEPAQISSSDVVIVDRPWQLPYVSRQMDRKTLLVYSSHNVEIELYSQLKQNPLTRPIWSSVRKLEKSAIETADLTITMSERDKKIYEDEYGADEIHVAPAAGYLSDHERVSSKPDLPFKEEEADLIICFVGNNHYPNVEAVKEIESMMTQDLDSVDNIHVLVIGNVCDAFVPDELNSNIHLLGFVEDLSAYYGISDVALNPITSGSGVNIKMVEYFQHGLLTISTPFGSRGIQADPGVHYIQSNLSEFSESILSIKNDRGIINEMGEEAQSLVRRKLNWTAVSDDLFSELRARV